MKKINLALLPLLFSVTVAQATTDTGNWHLIFDNGVEVNFIAGVSVLTEDKHNSEVDSHAYVGDDSLLTFHGVSNIVDHANGISKDLIGYANHSEGSEDVFDYVEFRQVVEDANGNQVSNRFLLSVTNLPGFDVNHSFFSSLEDIIDTDYNLWDFDSRNDFTGKDISLEGVKLTSISSVPVPGAVWLFGTALSGLLIRRNLNGFSYSFRIGGGRH